MVKTIWKFSLHDKLEQADGYLVSTVDLPASADVLSTAVQQGDVVIWASVDSTASSQPKKTRRFAIVPTGGNVPNGGLSPRFLGTVLMQDGDVWHVFAL